MSILIGCSRREFHTTTRRSTTSRTLSADHAAPVAAHLASESNVPDSDTGPRVDLDVGEIPLRALPEQGDLRADIRGRLIRGLRSGSSRLLRCACAPTGISAACRITPVYFAAERHAAAFHVTKIIRKAGSDPKPTGCPMETSQPLPTFAYWL
jgi:hypothetical protein